MDEPRQHDAGASLTDSVRQFRRVARLADADPLRLMPLDALAQLASLSAPVADLIDLAPFERLRHGVAAPPAAPRRDPPRMRLQPFAGAGHDVRTKPPAAAGPPAPQVVTRNAALPDARREPSSSPAAVRSAGEPPTRDAVSTTTLADRRAALRRRTIDAGSSPGSTSSLVAQAATATGSRSTAQHEAREIAVGARNRQGVMPIDPVLFDRDNVTIPSNGPFASAALDRATHDPLFADDPPAASAPSDRSSAPAPLAAVGIPAGRDMPAAAVRRDPNDPGWSAVAHAPSLPVPGRWSQSARTPQPDALRHVWEPPGESELADALFETLYRNGVDLPWP